MTKLNKSLKRNTEAVSGITVILVIAVIVILLWQFVVPLLDEGFPSLTESIFGDETDYTFDLSWRDKVTGQTIPLYEGWFSDKNVLAYSELKEYQLQLNTNAVYSFGDQYRLIVHAQSHNFVDNGDVDNWETWAYSVNGIGYESWFSDVIRYDMPTHTDYSLWIKVDLYSPAGVIIKQWDVRLPEIDDEPVTYIAEEWDIALDIGGTVYWSIIWD